MKFIFDWDHLSVRIAIMSVVIAPIPYHYYFPGDEGDAAVRTVQLFQFRV